MIPWIQDFWSEWNGMEWKQAFCPGLGDGEHVQGGILIDIVIVIRARSSWIQAWDEACAGEHLEGPCEVEHLDPIKDEDSNIPGRCCVNVHTADTDPIRGSLRLWYWVPDSFCGTLFLFLTFGYSFIHLFIHTFYEFLGWVDDRTGIPRLRLIPKSIFRRFPVSRPQK